MAISDELEQTRLAAALARAALSSWGVQPAVPLNYEQDPDCARLTGAMTYPLSFAFTR